MLNAISSKSKIIQMDINTETSEQHSVAMK